MQVSCKTNHLLFVTLHSTRQWQHYLGGGGMGGPRNGRGIGGSVKSDEKLLRGGGGGGL